MRSLIPIILVLQFLSSQNCASKENESKGQSWLNIKYVECLKNSLPCDCQQITKTYYSLTIDTNPDSKNFGVALSKFEQMEPYVYPIKKVAPNEYEVLKNREDASGWARIIISGAELQFIENDIQSKFIQSKKSKDYDVQHSQTDNVNLLDEAFTTRGYPKLEEIVKENALSCDCNKWMKNVNVLYVKGAPKSWIMEIRNDSLVIEKITNVDRDPDDPVQTKRVNSYKWK